jgi:mono/diheme cytochrome c family protein
MIQATACAAAFTIAATLATTATAQAPRPVPPQTPTAESPRIPRSTQGGKTANPAAASAKASASRTTPAEAQIARGKRLVDSHDCHACHTPFKMGPNGPEPDMSLALSGHPEKLVMPPPPKLEGPWGWVGSSSNTAFAGPWGITYAINLTPDPVTGIGKWQHTEFVEAIKTGKHLGVGRPIMPPMPWPAYKNLSDQQLGEIFAYLRSVPPIRNKVPDYTPPKK